MDESLPVLPKPVLLRREPSGISSFWLDTKGYTADQMRQYALDALAAARGEWQDISTAPKGGSIIDLWAGSRRIVNCYWHEREWLIRNDDVHAVANPSHWMYPPEPPQ